VSLLPIVGSISQPSLGESKCRDCLMPRSRCVPECKALVPADVVEDQGRIVMVKHCPEHH